MESTTETTGRLATSPGCTSGEPSNPAARHGGGGGAYLGRRTPTPATPFDPAAAATRLERLLVLLRQVLREGGAS